MMGGLSERTDLRVRRTNKSLRDRFSKLSEFEHRPCDLFSKAEKNAAQHS